MHVVNILPNREQLLNLQGSYLMSKNYTSTGLVGDFLEPDSSNRSRQEREIWQ